LIVAWEFEREKRLVSKMECEVGLMAQAARKKLFGRERKASAVEQSEFPAAGVGATESRSVRRLFQFLSLTKFPFFRLQHSRYLLS